LTNFWSRTTPAKPSRGPAHELWAELTTRISLRDLHTQSGQEEAAVESLVTVFRTARELMRKNAEATRFQLLGAAFIETLRPYTARWHGLQDEQNRFLGPAQRAQFREELDDLRQKLEPFAAALNEMAETGDCANMPAVPQPATPTLGADVPIGLDLDHALPFKPDQATLSPRHAFELMNAYEQQHLVGRRDVKSDPRTGALLNGTGLALSGGGIRSATFCLGVVEVLAKAKLLQKFDYLSTVSGGGYLGTFLSSQFVAADVNAETQFLTDKQAAQNARQKADESRAAADIKAAESAESTVAQERARTRAAASAAYDDTFADVSKEAPQVRHLRNSSKYLLPTTSLERLKLVMLLISGVLATTLLTAAVPVFSAYLVHWFPARWWHLLDKDFTVLIPFLDTKLQVLWFAALCGVALAAICWLVRPITFVWRRFSDALDTIASYVSVLAAAIAALAITPTLLNLLTGIKLPAFSITGIVTFVTGASVVKAFGVAWKYRRALSRLFILSGGLIFVLLYLLTLDLLGGTQSSELANLNGAPAFSIGSLGISWGEIITLGVLIVWLFWVAGLNLNLTGLHRYYRDRLASCYLDEPPVSRNIPHPPPLDRLSAKLPYHLINTTVNLASSRNPELRGRGGDFFLLSKYFCGSQVTGYEPTPTVSGMNSDLDLATAMAVSGAAASTNMGYQTFREYRTLMAIFNVRLGYWLRWRKTPSGKLASTAFTQLMREITGSLDETASMINLSDGGHIENLGAYELIRRRLKFIICIDGGADGTMDCGDLNRLQRLVAIDLGYHIEFDTTKFRLKDNFSTGYGALAKIDYAPGDGKAPRDKQLGWMLYIKLAMLGTEPNYVLDYKRENPHFPHQSTGDQFFDEAQFEAYRKLGESAGRSFLSTQYDTEDVHDFEPWFQALVKRLLPDSDEVYEP
jgi:hypothetical protein